MAQTLVQPVTKEAAPAKGQPHINHVRRVDRILREEHPEVLIALAKIKEEVS